MVSLLVQFERRLVKTCVWAHVKNIMRRISIMCVYACTLYLPDKGILLMSVYPITRYALCTMGFAVANNLLCSNLLSGSSSKRNTAATSASCVLILFGSRLPRRRLLTPNHVWWVHVTEKSTPLWQLTNMASMLYIMRHNGIMMNMAWLCESVCQRYPTILVCLFTWPPTTGFRRIHTHFNM
jgi:hypothetical protein